MQVKISEIKVGGDMSKKLSAEAALSFTMQNIPNPKGVNKLVKGQIDLKQNSAGGQTREIVASIAKVSHDSRTMLEYSGGKYNE